MPPRAVEGLPLRRALRSSSSPAERHSRSCGRGGTSRAGVGKPLAPGFALSCRGLSRPLSGGLKPCCSSREHQNARCEHPRDPCGPQVPFRVCTIHMQSADTRHRAGSLMLTIIGRQSHAAPGRLFRHLSFSAAAPSRRVTSRLRLFCRAVWDRQASQRAEGRCGRR